jgi:hypothetical protein
MAHFLKKKPLAGKSEKIAPIGRCDSSLVTVLRRTGLKNQ